MKTHQPVLVTGGTGATGGYTIDALTKFAREAGLKGIVNMSQLSARRDSKSHQARDHWISERVFDCSGVRVTHRRPTFFAQWLTYPRVRHGIAEKGLISLPFGNGRHAPIAAEAALAGTASITAINRDSKRGAGLVALLQQKTQARAALVVTRTDWTSASKLRGAWEDQWNP